MRPALTSRPVIPLFKQLCRYESLEKAWTQVRSNATKSGAVETRAEARRFELSAGKSLRSIQSRLSAKRFQFAPQRGVLIEKPGSTKKRPVVIAPIESRIVQRAILNIVQSVPSLKMELHAGFNFGGVDGSGFGVPGAIAKAVQCAQAGGYFIRTDIKKFFTAVPRDKAVDSVCAHFSSEKDLINIFKAAALTELEDAARFGDDIGLFPLADEGVAQGSCLSPLLCNYLLSNFDRQMNTRGVVCIRYVDDFILFAKDRKTANLAFAAALEALENLGLSAYDPFKADDAAKAEHGQASSGFTFLGCNVWPNKIRPSDEKRSLLLDKVDGIFKECLKASGNSKKAIRSGDQVATFAGAILAASNIVRAWGNTYSFCCDDRLMNDIDIQLNDRITSFRRMFFEKTQTLNPLDKRRALGLFSLADCNRDKEPSSARTIALRAP